MMIVYKVCREVDGRYFSANPFTEAIAQFVMSDGTLPEWANKMIVEYKVGEKTTFLDERPGFSFRDYESAKMWVTPGYPGDHNMRIFRADLTGLIRPWNETDEEWCGSMPTTYSSCTLLSTEITLLALVASVIDHKLVEHE